MEGIMAGKEISVKKYVVRLSGEEREQLEVLIRKGKGPARRLLKARILLKADVSERGPGWSDSKIIAALDTSASMVYRVRKQLVEEGFAAVLSRKQRATPAVPRIFDGEKEAKLIALACSKPPKGCGRWTLRLLENKVVELGIVARASDSTIGRTLKKTYGAPRSQVVSTHDNLTSLRQRIRSRRYFPGQDGDPRVPVLINRFGVDDAIFLTRVPGRRSTVRPSRFPPPANIEGQSAHCAAGQSGLCRRRDGETERLAVPQHRPGQTRQLVGQRDHDGVFVHSRHQAAQPCPQRGRTLKQCGQGRSGTMDQKLAEIFIAPLADSDQTRSAAGR
jgi:transposase